MNAVVGLCEELQWYCLVAVWRLADAVLKFAKGREGGQGRAVRGWGGRRRFIGRVA